MAEAPVVSFEGVTVRYGPRIAVAGVTLRVPQGCVYALLGRNGSGKSSLVRCLLGMQRPQAGRALLFGRDAWRERATLLQRVGVVPEVPDAPAELTALQLSSLCARLHGTWDAPGVLARLERFGVPPRVALRDLSKGQKGGVMLALALGHGPDLLVLDDPTLGLDVVARAAVFGELIGDLAERGLTVFLTTHDLGAAERMADRAGILHAGRLVADDDVAALKDRLRAGAGEPLTLEDVFRSTTSEGRAA